MAAVITMSCSSVLQAQTKTDDNMKSVIIYFTHSGNTELAAKQVAEVTGADATLKKGYPSLKIRKGLRLPAKSEEIKKWIEQ